MSNTDYEQYRSLGEAIARADTGILSGAGLTVREYQVAAARTAPDVPEMGSEEWERAVMIAALGLVGEAGEFADQIKKVLGHGHTLQPGKVILELGDVAWYVARLARLFGVSLESVLWANVGKLATRYPRGFNAEDSKARVDVAEGE